MGAGLAQAARSLGPLGKQPGRDWFLTQSSGWDLSCREAYHTRDGFSSVSPWSALTGKAPDLQCQLSGISCTSSGQRRKDPAVWNHSQVARQSLLPAFRVEIWPPVVSGPLFPGRPAPLPASPGRHIFKDGSLLFSSLPPGSLSLKPSAACMQASCSHTSHFCSFLSKSMSKPHDPCIFFYCTY